MTRDLTRPVHIQDSSHDILPFSRKKKNCDKTLKCDVHANIRARLFKASLA